MTVFVEQPCHQGSANWLSWLSEITENPISHGNFSLEIMYKIPKTGYFQHKKFLSQKQVNVTKKLSVTETNFLNRNKLCHRNQFLSKNKF